MQDQAWNFNGSVTLKNIWVLIFNITFAKTDTTKITYQSKTTLNESTGCKGTELPNAINRDQESIEGNRGKRVSNGHYR